MLAVPTEAKHSMNTHTQTDAQTHIYTHTESMQRSDTFSLVALMSAPASSRATKAPVCPLIIAICSAVNPFTQALVKYYYSDTGGKVLAVPTKAKHMNPHVHTRTHTHRQTNSNRHIYIHTDGKHAKDVYVLISHPSGLCTFTLIVRFLPMHTHICTHMYTTTHTHTTAPTHLYHCSSL